MTGRGDGGQGHQESGQGAEPKPVDQGIDDGKPHEEQHPERQLHTNEAPKPVQTTIKPKAYADNFRFGRTENWSH